jgi:hypothetical protein
MLEVEELFSNEFQKEQYNTHTSIKLLKINRDESNSNNEMLEPFTHEILSIIDTNYESISIVNYVTYRNNLFVYPTNNQNPNSISKYRFYEKDIVNVLKPKSGSRIYIANFDVNCNTKYLYHIDVDTNTENCDKIIELYEDKILSCFKKCKEIVDVTSDNGVLIDFNKIEFSDEVNQMEKPQELNNFINNLSLNEDDLLIRFTINEVGLVSNAIVLLEL